jgi:general secretion pathway protein A
MNSPRPSFVTAISIALFLLVGVAQPPFADGSSPLDQDQAREAARLLAILLDTGRVVLARYQDEINDPERAAKAFGPQIFEADVVDEFARRSGGLDLRDPARLPSPSRTRELLVALLQTGTEVVRDRKAVIDQPFLGYKNLIPATWGTWTAAKFSLRTGVRLKQTALDFRNPANAPDALEREILTQFAAPSYPRSDLPVSMIERDGSALRLLLPLFHHQECLTCHGQPKGEIDISGYRKEGHVEGDSAGAISVSIPLVTAPNGRYHGSSAPRLRHSDREPRKSPSRLWAGGVPMP